MEEKKILVLYHGHCPDGFGAAYAAWKKFGDEAVYEELSRSTAPSSDHLVGKEVYFLDFTYDDPLLMKQYDEAAESLTVLDHHVGVRSVTESVRNHVYDVDRSGAGIAWDYFHPHSSRPLLINYIEDDDLFRFSYPDTKAVLAYLGLSLFTFPFWDETAQKLESEVEGPQLLQTAHIYAEAFQKLAELSVRSAKMIRFEGHTCAFGTAHPYKPIKSLVGNMLAKQHPPFALVVSAHPNGYGISIRGDGSVDVALIAKKYGGNGHANSAGFLVPNDRPIPWELIDKHEDSRD